MTTPIVPPDADDTDAMDVTDATDAGTTRRRRRWYLLGAFFLVVAGLTTAAFLVELPYYLIQPGSVRPAEQRVVIEGAPSFETDGEVLFTTVYLSRATPALMVRAWLDDAVKIRTEDEMYPEGDRDESRRVNRQRMDLSKLTATRVALDRVGVEATYAADGARVLGVIDDGPSAGVLRPSDVIVGVDGGEVALPDDIGNELDDRAPGDVVEVEVERDGSDAPEEVQIVLGESPASDGRPILGVEVEPANPQLESPVEVEVDSGEVSGPSAGLAWTLAIIDRMTPGSLTDGERIAVTGEILDDGSVGPIGGITQKVAAVKRAGIELFIYPAATPAAEQAEMRRIAGDDVTLWPVEDIDEAIDLLAPDGLPTVD